MKQMVSATLSRELVLQAAKHGLPIYLVFLLSVFLSLEWSGLSKFNDLGNPLQFKAAALPVSQHASKTVKHIERSGYSLP